MSDELEVTFDYGPIERDLSALVADRVERAIQSVLQIASTTEQAFMIAIAAHASAAAVLAGAGAALQGIEASEVDPMDFALEVLRHHQSVLSGVETPQ